MEWPCGWQVRDYVQGLQFVLFLTLMPEPRRTQEARCVMNSIMRPCIASCPALFGTNQSRQRMRYSGGQLVSDGSYSVDRRSKLDKIRWRSEFLQQRPRRGIERGQDRARAGSGRDPLSAASRQFGRTIRRPTIGGNWAVGDRLGKFGLGGVPKGPKASARPIDHCTPSGKYGQRAARENPRNGAPAF